MTPDLSNAELLSQRYGAPVWLFERSGEARAKASQSTVDDVLSMWAEGEGKEDASPQTPDASPEVADSGQQTDDSPTTDSSDEATPSPSSPSGGGADEGGGGGQNLTGPALLTAVAEARGMPESVVERSAQARASAAGVNLDDVLHEWAAEEGLEDPNPEVVPSSQPPSKSPTVAASTPLPTPTPKAKPITPTVAGLTGAALLTAVAEARGMPESLVERSAKARAKKTDATVEDVLSEWAEEEGVAVTSPQTPDASPTAEASSSSPSGGGADEGGGGGQNLTGPALLTAVAEARGMPESLVERSAKARAKKTDATVEDILQEWAQEEGVGAASPQTPAAGPTTEASSSSPLGGGADEGGGGGQNLTGPALLTAVAEARGMPESLVERSAKARAKKTDATVEDILSEWAAEEGVGAASPTAEASSSSPSGGGADEGGGGGQNLTGPALLTAVAEARGMPESLVERSAKARAKKTDATVEDILQEWAAEEGVGAASPQTPDASPTAEASSSSPSGGGADEGGGGGQSLTGPALLTAVAEARGMPESLVERSAKARAKKTDATVEDILQEWAAEEGVGAASPQTPDASPTGTALTGPALLTAVAEARGMPESLVERSAKARAKKTDATVEDILQEWAQEEGLTVAGLQTPDAGPAAAPVAADTEVAAQVPAADVQEQDTTPETASRPVKSWRHTLAVGAVTALVPLAILIVLAVFVDVPSDLSEVPWYLIGLDPFLGYLEPFMVLVIIPGVVLSSIVIVPIVAWSPSVHPSTRRVALMVLVFLLLTIAALTIIGALQA